MYVRKNTYIFMKNDLVVNGYAEKICTDVFIHSLVQSTNITIVTRSYRNMFKETQKDLYLTFYSNLGPDHLLRI